MYMLSVPILSAHSHSLRPMKTQRNPQQIVYLINDLLTYQIGLNFCALNKKNEIMGKVNLKALLCEPLPACNLLHFSLPI